ncbi:MAG: hypothetical protein LBF68_01335 [Christensenellaceae bacterium]|jgi:hypothetical protein|nr:hypothetical protein [Christensenellaceae bacterium]
MNNEFKKYSEYFDIDKNYFPCIDDAAIEAGAPWKNTYPHKSFINLLTEFERALSRRNDKKSLWVEGAYGTGKSQCVFALRRILEVTDQELSEWWDTKSPLKQKTDLRDQLIKHKREGIVVAHRYGAGGITSPQQLAYKIQESVKEALIKQEITYRGEGALKGSAIKWLQDKDNNEYVTKLLTNPQKQWRDIFSQSCADDLISSLEKNENVDETIKNILSLVDAGITALDFNADRLVSWLKDVIDKNKTKIVLIWDEFSDYFKENSNSLSEFQKIVSLVQDKPFYFIVVTHQAQDNYIKNSAQDDAKKMLDRFVSIKIDLPDNTAFDLIGDAFKVKSDAEKSWNQIIGALDDRVSTIKDKVMDIAKIDNQETIQRILPIHPMTALFLKHIAVAFQSNQRSMFDYIKSGNKDDDENFQWYIENHSPDKEPFLTVDMLWNFFYDKQIDKLQPEVKSIVNFFKQHSKGMCDDHKRVLKVILIMQSLDQRFSGDIELFKATDQNLNYVFEASDFGVSRSIAKKMRQDGILIYKKSNNISYYFASVHSGDQAEIDKKKEMLRNAPIHQYIVEAGMSKILSLPKALSLRFEEEQDGGIKSIISALGNFKDSLLLIKPENWKFKAVMVFAKDDSGVKKLREKIKEAVKDEQYKHNIFIDTQSTPLGEELLEEFINHYAESSCYQGNDSSLALEYLNKAYAVLNEKWKKNICNGKFFVFTHSKPDGVELNGEKEVADYLKKIVLEKFPYIFDFTDGLKDPQLQLNVNRKIPAKSGISCNTSGVVAGIEEKILKGIWNIPNYWEDPAKDTHPISIIKKDLDHLIENKLDNIGRIAINEICSFLQDNYGFSRSDLSIFLTGFLLKEYAQEPYRYGDSNNGYATMTHDYLIDMIANNFNPKLQKTFIVKITEEEMTFYNFTKQSWDVDLEKCPTITSTMTKVIEKMKKLKLPVWCLEYIDDENIFYVVQKYIEFVQSEGSPQYDKAVEIGRILDKLGLSEKLTSLLTYEKCMKGMNKYLEAFENGIILELAEDIGAHDKLIDDICNLFKVKHSSLWKKEIGEKEIQTLQIKYGIVKESNKILDEKVNSLNGAYKKWKEKLNFIGISADALKIKYSDLAEIFDLLLKICNSEEQDKLSDSELKQFYNGLQRHAEELKRILDDPYKEFAEIYKLYLDGLNSDEIYQVYLKIEKETTFLNLTKSNSNKRVKDVADQYQKAQSKSELLELWKKPTKSKDPIDWSKKLGIPILYLVDLNEFDKAKKTFEVLNNVNGRSDNEINDAKNYLLYTTLITTEFDDEKINDLFKKHILGSYSILLKDIDGVKEKLKEIEIVDGVYGWYENPKIKEKVKELALLEYNAGGSDDVIKKIKQMDDELFKSQMSKLVEKNMTLGIEIMEIFH